MSYRVSPPGIAVTLGFFCTLLLAGCGSGVVPSADTSSTSGSSGSGSAVHLSGTVLGGQQPISGSAVSIYAAGTSGYGTGAKSLLSGSTSVVTDAKGKFTITSNVNCPSANAQIYLIATGGDAGSGKNNQAVLMTALGNCGSLDANSAVNINEVTTVAAVYALAQFMTPGSTAVGTSSTNTTGLLNAFQTAANLADFSTGNARTATPAGNGTVSLNTIHTLADILAACVDSGSNGKACTSLFSAATPPNGSAPTDTLAAGLDIALNPGHNVAQLYSLVSAAAPFQPFLAGAPNDWTLSIEYTGGGLNYGQLLAIDAEGDVWVPNAIDPGTLSEFSPNGEALSPKTGFNGGGLSYPQQVAIDGNNNVWAANYGNSSVSEHTSGGTALSGSGFTAQGLHHPFAIAIDGAGNIFIANDNNRIIKLNNAGSSVAQFVNGGLDVPYSIAIDSSQNIWVANNGVSNGVSKFSNSGTAASITGFTGGGINGAFGIALDANNSAWIANFGASSVSELNNSGSPLSGAGYSTPAPVSAVAVDGNNTLWTANTDGSISHFASNGAAISPNTGYISADATGEVGIAIDASGNVWTTDNSINSLFEYVGAAAPAVVPLQQAVKTGRIGQRP
jgi:hypothetical protein